MCVSPSRMFYTKLYIVFLTNEYIHFLCQIQILIDMFEFVIYIGVIFKYQQLRFGALFKYNARLLNLINKVLFHD